MELKVGQWVKCIVNHPIFWDVGKYYKIRSAKLNDEVEQLSIYCKPNNLVGFEYDTLTFKNSYNELKFFDFKNPLDYNPDEMV